MNKEDIQRELDAKIKEAEQILQSEEPPANHQDKTDFGDYIKYESRCKVCKSSEADKIHEEKLNGRTYQEIIETHPDLKLNIQNLHTHFTNHFKLEKALVNAVQEQEIAKIGTTDITSSTHLKEVIADKTYSLIETHTALANDIADRRATMMGIVDGVMKESGGSPTAQEIDSISKINNQIAKAESTLASVLQAIDRKLFPSSAGMTINFMQNYMQILRKTAIALAKSYEVLLGRIKAESDNAKKETILEEYKKELSAIFKTITEELKQSEISARADEI